MYLLKSFILSSCLFATFFTTIEASSVQEGQVQAPIHFDASTQIAAANAFAKAGNYAQALEELNQIIAQNPDHARAYKIRGNVYYAMGDYTQALRDLHRVVTLVPDSANAYCDRAIALSMIGNHGQALTDIERALKIKPDSSFAQSVREKILERASEK